MMLPSALVVMILGDAFRPLKCNAVFCGRVFTFRFSKKGLVVTPFGEPPEYSASDLRDRARLEQVISEWRQRLQEAGYELHPWAMPSDDARLAGEIPALSKQELLRKLALAEQRI